MTCVSYALAESPARPPQPTAVGSSAAALSILVPYVPPAPVAPTPVAAPVALTIPAIGVSTTLQQLGLAPNGALELPPPGPLYDIPGWYRDSPAPGAIGPAIIAGHVDSAANGPSVFFRLGALRPGDQITVRLADGSTAVFAVDSVRAFAKSAFPTALVYGNTDVPALRLITCGGALDRSTGHYEDNVVVLAHLLTRNTDAALLVVKASN